MIQKAPRLCAQVALVVGALTLASCREYWTVERAAEPNPFVGVTEMTAAPVRFVDLIVDEVPESEYLAELDSDQRRRWNEDKAAILDNIRARLLEAAAEQGLSVTSSSAPYELRSTISEIETGYYRFPAALAVARITLELEIRNRDGEVVEQVRFADDRSWGIFSASTGGRLRAIATSIGGLIASYLAGRVNP